MKYSFKPKSESEECETETRCINTMERKDLVALPYLNVKIAEDILKKRPFHEWGDLLKVNGLGQKRVDMLRQLPYVSLSETDDLAFLFQNLSVNNNYPPIIINEDPPFFLRQSLHLSERILNQIVRLRPFEDWTDLQARVSGIGRKTLRRLQRCANPSVKVNKSDENCSAGSSTVIDFDLKDFPWLESKAPRLDTEGIVVATWNIRHFSPRRDPPLAHIARIIEKFDLVAIQEIRDPCVITDLLNAHLPTYWSATISHEIKFGHREDRQFTEYFAFVYNTEKVKCIETVVIDSGGLWRDPFTSRFSIGDLSFLLCTVHLIWSGDLAEEMTKLEEVVQSLKKNGEEFMIMGDFNTEEFDDSFDLTPLLSENQGTSTFSAMTPLGHLYDNICVLKKTEQSWFQESGIYCFDVAGFEQTREGRRKAKMTVSDHRPVWALLQPRQGQQRIPN